MTRRLTAMSSTLKGLFGGEGEKGDAAASGATAGASPLSGLFGGTGSDAAKASAQDFVNRVQQGAPHEGFTHEEALGHLAAAAQHATPEQVQAATKAAVAKLPEDQRAEFGQMLQQRMSGTAANVNAPTGGNTSVDNVSGMLNQVLGTSGGGGGLLGGLLGGGQSSGGGLGGMLGGLLGGGNQSSSAQSQGGGGAGDVLGGIFKSNTGKAVLGSLAAMVLTEVMRKK
jgi:hypothetical protein